jgi:hypothetical protein
MKVQTVGPERRRRFLRAALVLGCIAAVATVGMFASGFITSGPRWSVTVVGSLVAFSAIGSVLCLFIGLFDSA